MERRSGAAALAGGLAAGVVLDAIFGDPKKFHPVAGFGRSVSALERRMYADDYVAGASFAAVAVGVPVALGFLADRVVRRRPALMAAAVAGTTWVVLGGTTLRREASAMATALERGDLATARARLPHLCGRQQDGLTEKELTRATIESVAENTSDAAVAPLLWGAIGGIPGLISYRAVNTLDAMVGAKSPRYLKFGMTCARLDDFMNLLPSRMTGLLTVAAAPVLGGNARRAMRVWLRDRAKHPSPNSGQCEAATAGALNIRLGGPNVYAGRVENRPCMGDGPLPEVADIARAARLSAIASAAASGVAVAIALGRGMSRLRGRNRATPRRQS